MQREKSSALRPVEKALLIALSRLKQGRAQRRTRNAAHCASVSQARLWTMHRHVRTTALALLTTALLGQAATGQEPKKLNGKIDSAEGGIEPPKYPGEVVPPPKPYVVKVGKGKGDTPGERSKQPGGGVLKLTASSETPRLRPGEASKLLVVFAPTGETMLLSPPPVTFLSPPEQGAVTLRGEPQFRPATPGAKSRSLKGIVVYEDTAILEIPFSIGEKATPGLHHVDLSFRYELVASMRGGVLGPFTDSVGVDVQVVAATEEAARVDSTLSSNPSADTGSKGLEATTHTAADAAKPGDKEPAPAPPTPESGSYLLLGAGLSLLVLIGFALLRSRSSTQGH